jgi:hypothetical protein
VQTSAPSFSTQQHDSTIVAVFSQTMLDPTAASVEDATNIAKARLPRSFFMTILQFEFENLDAKGRARDQFRRGCENSGGRSGGMCPDAGTI